MNPKYYLYGIAAVVLLGILAIVIVKRNAANQAASVTNTDKSGTSTTTSASGKGKLNIYV